MFNMNAPARTTRNRNLNAPTWNHRNINFNDPVRNPKKHISKYTYMDKPKYRPVCDYVDESNLNLNAPTWKNKP